MLSTNPLPTDHVFIDFCDRDANWGPLLFLRPQRTVRIGLGRTIVGAVLLGLPLGLIGTIAMTLFARLVAQPAPTLMYFPLILTLAYWAVAQITLARAWNRRAARLARWS
jgi:hypothetical protein